MLQNISVYVWVGFGQKIGPTSISGFIDSKNQEHFSLGYFFIDLSILSSWRLEMARVRL